MMYLRLNTNFLDRKTGEVIKVDDATANEMIMAGTASLESTPTKSINPRHNIGDWLLCLRNCNAKRLADEYHSFPIKAGMKAAITSTSGSLGGYTVPTDLVPDILQAVTEQSIVRPRATVVPMHNREALLPYLDITKVPASADSSFFGGLVARWASEATTINETEPSFKQLQLIARELSGYSVTSTSLMTDTPDGLQATIVQLFASAVAWYEDYAFLQGNGLGKPMGAFQAPNAVSVNRANAGQFGINDAANMLEYMLPTWNPETTCWVISPSVLSYLIRIPATASYITWRPSNRNDGKTPLLTFLGLDVMISEKMSQLGTPRDVGLCDFQYYIIGDRRQIDVECSLDFKFTNNQAAWRFVSRVDGQPWISSSVTLQNGQTASNAIYLT
jgi:HK97 family phage major capsid protein